MGTEDELTARIRSLQAERLRPQPPPPREHLGLRWSAVLARRELLAHLPEDDDDEPVES